MSNYQKSYDNLNDTEKRKVIEQLYHHEKMSFADVAKQYNTYANRIRRDAKSFNIPIRNKSEAQKNALEIGKHKHPTKGSSRDQDTKNKIGMSVLKSWSNISDSELKKRKAKAKAAWEAMNEEDRENILQKANEAVRHASKVGSKLERYLLERLLKDGYKVDFHKEQMLVTTKLQIDLFLPTMNTAIEVDGPSHFEPVWGDESLKRNIKYDNKKTGLILGKGLVLIRIKQTKDFSKSRAELIFQQLHEALIKIKNKFPDANNRTIELGDE